MAYNFIEYEQNQSFLLPPSILDWVEEDGLAHFVSDTLNTIYHKGELITVLPSLSFKKTGSKINLSRVNCRSRSTTLRRMGNIK